ncbi:MAG: hypothetical protein JWM36_825 [Hyphomicrobiales bacterium]|nr:hypothetical protein [Hyphomicrobiales bacterium]
MRGKLILAAVTLAASAANAHTIFPGQQTVLIGGDRAFVKFEAANARKDVSEFAVEVFERGNWHPSRQAVPFPARLTVRAPTGGSMASTNRPFSVLVDLGGKPEQRLRVCTKTISTNNMLRPNLAQVNTRVCANVTVRRIAQ